MQLTDLQLEIQNLGADRSSSFGSLFYEEKTNKVVRYVNEFDVKDDTQEDSVNYFDGDKIKTTNCRWLIKDNNLGHPITYSRLCYRKHKQVEEFAIPNKSYHRQKMRGSFERNPELYNQSILERPEELQLLVKDFLISIQ